MRLINGPAQNDCVVWVSLRQLEQTRGFSICAFVAYIKQFDGCLLSMGRNRARKHDRE
jgi:hypothetical protein